MKYFDENTLVSFRMGRGGRFHNGGHLYFLDFNKPIRDYVNDDVFPPMIGEKIDTDPLAEFTDCNGNRVGLTNKEYEEGVGKIDLDGIYNTCYVTRLGDIDERELTAMLGDYSFAYTSTTDLDLISTLYDLFPSLIVEHICDEEDFSEIDLAHIKEGTNIDEEDIDTIALRHSLI